MKKIFGLMFTTIVLMSCGGGEKKETTSTNETKTAEANKPLSENPDYQKGLALIAGSDCLTCHKTSEKLIGPAYKDVATKYEATEDNIKLLASKILKGGSGVWGAIPMTPHAQLKEEDAIAMVKYIFLLKK